MAETRTFKGVTYANGELPKSLMKKVNGKHGTRRNSDAYLRSDAADALNGAIAEIKKKYGYDLTIRGWNRTYAEQAKFFYQRWTTTPYRGRPTKRWNDKTWYLKPGYAAASAPGYSNHGWGTTIDVNDFGGVGNFNHPNRKKFYPILRKWGFDDSEGRDHIREPWHLEYKDSMNKMKGKHKPKHKDNSNSKDWFDMATKKDLEDALLSVLKTTEGRKALARAVWQTDGVISAPADTDTKKNPHWAAEGLVKAARSNAIEAKNAAKAAENAAKKD